MILISVIPVLYGITEADKEIKFDCRVTATMETKVIFLLLQFKDDDGFI